jgi:hypothetical protein
MITTKNKAAFWGAVEDCLVEFHNLSRDVAHEKSATFRECIEALPRRTTEDIIYHEEPFYLACDLAGQRFELDPYRERYYQILDCRGW